MPGGRGTYSKLQGALVLEDMYCGSTHDSVGKVVYRLDSPS